MQPLSSKRVRRKKEGGFALCHRCSGVVSNKTMLRGRRRACRRANRLPCIFNAFDASFAQAGISLPAFPLEPVYKRRTAPLDYM